MIQFQNEWAKDMDGSDVVPSLVNEVTDPGTASDSVDFVIASVCNDADDVDDAVAHLNYIIKQLSILRDNMKRK